MQSTRQRLQKLPGTVEQSAHAAFRRSWMCLSSTWPVTALRRTELRAEVPCRATCAPRKTARCPQTKEPAIQAELSAESQSGKSKTEDAARKVSPEKKPVSTFLQLRRAEYRPVPTDKNAATNGYGPSA